jgi:hypothetical protein
MHAVKLKEVISRSRIFIIISIKFICYLIQNIE